MILSLITFLYPTSVLTGTLLILGLVIGVQKAMVNKVSLIRFEVFQNSKIFLV